MAQYYVSIDNLFPTRTDDEREAIQNVKNELEANGLSRSYIEDHLEFVIAYFSDDDDDIIDEEVECPTTASS